MRLLLGSLVVQVLSLESTVEKRLLPLHSITTGFYDQQYWDCQGACTWGPRGLSLSDPVTATRDGHLTSRLPILTDTFDVIIELSRSTSLTAVTHGASIFLTEWREPELQPGRVFGSNGTFKGLGFFAATFDRTSKRNPSLSGLLHMGTKTLDGRGKIPSEKGIYWTPSQGEYRLLLSVTPGQVVGKVYHPEKAVYADVFKAEMPVYDPQGYRLSLFVGSDDVGDIDEIAVKSITVNNINLTLPGESASAEVKPVEYVKEETVGSADASAMAQVVASQVMYAIKAKHDEVLSNVRQSNQRLVALDERLQTLESVLTHHVPQSIEHVKTEIDSVRRILDSTHRQFSGMNVSMNNVQEKLALTSKSKQEGVIQALSDHVERVQSSIIDSSKSTFYVTLFACAMITTGLLLLWRRLTKIEKKHYL